MKWHSCRFRFCASYVIVATMMGVLSCNTPDPSTQASNGVQNARNMQENIKEKATDTKAQTATIKQNLDKPSNEKIKPQIDQIEKNQDDIIKSADSTTKSIDNVEKETSKVVQQRDDLQEKLDSPLHQKIQWGMIISFIIIAGGGAMMSPFVGMFKQGLTVISIGVSLLIVCYFVRWIIDLMPWIILTISVGLIILVVMKVKRAKDEREREKADEEKTVDELVESFEMAKKLLPPRLREKLTGGKDGVTNGEVGRIQSERTVEKVMASRKKQKDKWSSVS